MEDTNLNPNEGSEEVVASQENEQVESNSESANEESTTSQNEEKQVQSSEDNAKYADVRRKTESDTRDKLIAEMYGESHGINTYSEYQSAMKSQQEQEQMNELVEKNIPEEYAKEMMENRKFREESKTEKAKQAEEQAKQKDYNDFMTEYPGIKAEDIPTDVWESVDKGKSLVDAYAKHEMKQIKAELAEFKKGSKANETNTKNALNSTGSINGNSPNQTGFITKESFETNKKDSSWMSKNYETLKTSMNKW